MIAIDLASSARWVSIAQHYSTYIVPMPSSHDANTTFWGFSAFAQQFTCCDNALSQRCELQRKLALHDTWDLPGGRPAARRPPYRQRRRP